MADVRVSLEELREDTIETGNPAATTPMPSSICHGASRILALFAFLLAAALAAGWSVARLMRPPETPPLRTVRFTITPKQLLSGGGGQIDSEVSVSPDGKHIAYVESQGRQLWVRNIDEEEAHPVPGATGVYQAFWSADNRFIGYSFWQNCAMRPCDLFRVPIEGGTPMLITRLRGGFRRASWSSDGQTILYGEYPNGLFTIPVTGGSPTRIFEHPHLEHLRF